MPLVGSLTNCPRLPLRVHAIVRWLSRSSLAEPSFWFLQQNNLQTALAIPLTLTRQERERDQRLPNEGKAKKEALTAAMRKLLTILNTLIKNDELWNENKASG